MTTAALDAMVAIWTALAGVAFVASCLLGWQELATVVRFVYVVVLAAGLTYLALRLAEKPAPH